MGYLGNDPNRRPLTTEDIADGTITNADVNSSAAIAHSKLAALADGNILVGNGSNVAVSVNPSGDVDISNAGVFSIASAAVDFAHIQNVAANSILGRNANSSGVLSEVALATTQILIGDGTGFTAAALSGDATMTNAGVVTVADDAITLAKMASGTDGNIISYDASGNPVAVATGTDGQVLTSAGAGAPPVFEDAANGLSYCTQYRLTANHASGWITANWEVADTAGYETLGTAVGESSGEFTFPTTGYWYITLVGRASDNNGNGLGSLSTSIYTSVDYTAGSPTWVTAANSYQGGAYYQSSFTLTTTFLFKVTDVTTHAAKMNLGTSDHIIGDTSYNITHVTFTKLAGV